MQFVNDLIKSRATRGNLDPTKSYAKVHTVNGTQQVEEVGQFVKSYRMGSGDGMTIHWEFIKDGKTIRVDDDMWGSVAGTELIGFTELSQPVTAHSHMQPPSPKTTTTTNPQSPSTSTTPENR